MSELLSIADPWFWWILAGILLVGEMLMPGFFLLWLAAAAALTGAIDLVFGLGWQGEVITFAALSLLLVLITWKWVMESRRMKSDQPTLNLRHHAYVGRVVPLAQAIVNGSGKVRIDDALWDVDGPDLPQGAKVRISGVEGLRLKAEKV
jgi:membrane protein implicated in regulation of membrane protease activity